MIHYDTPLIRQTVLISSNKQTVPVIASRKPMIPEKSLAIDEGLPFVKVPHTEAVSFKSIY